MLQVHAVSSQRFLDAVDIARYFNVRVEENLAFLEHDELENAVFFLTDDSLSGFAITYDVILSNLFNISPEHRGDALVRRATSLGARKLNCFDGRLVNFYNRNGFVAVGREANWNEGGPDIVYLELSGVGN